MKIVIDSQFQVLRDYIAALPDALERGEGEVVYDERNRIARFRRDGYTFMVKRYKRVNVAQQIAYTFFRPSKARRAYEFAGIFAERGIATPQRVAYMERSLCGLFSVGYFVSLEVPGRECHLLLREVQDFSRVLADAVAGQIVRMHECGILHGDLNLSNFLAAGNDHDGYHFSMIDINRSHFTDSLPTLRQCLDNMVRLTHRRDLYQYLVESYARQRGLNPEHTAAQALHLLDRFEHSKRWF